MQTVEQTERKRDKNSTAAEIMSSEHPNRASPKESAAAGMSGSTHPDNPTPKIERHYRIITVMDLLNVSRQTIWRWVSDGSLAKPVKMGKGRIVAWRESDIQAFLEAGEP